MVNPINDLDLKISGYRDFAVIIALGSKLVHRYRKLAFLYILSFLSVLSFIYPVVNIIIFALIMHLIFAVLVIVWFIVSYKHACIKRNVINDSLDYVFPYMPIFLCAFPVIKLVISLESNIAKIGLLLVYSVVSVLTTKRYHRILSKKNRIEEWTKGQIDLDYDGKPLDIHSDGEYDVKKCYVSFELRPSIITKPGTTLSQKTLINQDTLSIYVACQRSLGLGLPYRVNCQISLKDVSGKEHFLAGRHIAPKENMEHTKWMDVHIDVKRFLGQEVTVYLKSFSMDKSTKHENVYWGMPHFSSSSRSGSAKKNIVFIIDGCRPDYLGCYNPKMAGVSPTIDKFRDDAVLFSNAFAQGTWTLPSFISIYTGCLPSTTRSWHPKERNPLSKSAPCLAEYFKEAGYRTAAFVSHTRATANYGFSRGFDIYSYRQRNFYYGNSTADDLIKKAIDFLDNTKNDDVFLLIHILDTHDKYYNITDYILNDEEFNSFNKGTFDVGLFNERHFLFRNSITKVDRVFSHLMQYLKTHGWYDNSTVVVSADHGTKFLKRQYSHYMYDEMLKVPLLIKPPSSLPLENKVVHSPVQTATAFLLTMMDINGIKYENTTDGTSLYKYIAEGCNADGDEKNYVLSEGIWLDYHAVACRTARDKLILTTITPNSQRNRWGGRTENKFIEYYDMKKDPNELRDLSIDKGNNERIKYLENKIELFLKNKKSRF